jgi:hypothetical protein
VTCRGPQARFALVSLTSFRCWSPGLDGAPCHRATGQARRQAAKPRRPAGIPDADGGSTPRRRAFDTAGGRARWDADREKAAGAGGGQRGDRPAGQPGLGVCGRLRQRPSWRAAVTRMRPSVSGPAQVGVTPHERLRLGMTFGTDAIIDRVEAGRLLRWRAHDRQKRLQGSRLVQATGPASCRFMLHRGGRGWPARSLAAAGAAGGLAAAAADQRRPATAQTPAGDLTLQQVLAGGTGESVLAATGPVIWQISGKWRSEWRVLTRLILDCLIPADGFQSSG